MPRTVDLHAKAVDGKWYAVAADGEALAASAVGTSREKVLASLRRSLPHGVGWRAADVASAFAEQTLAMLVELEAGREQGKQLSLSAVHAEPLAAILRVAAAIAVGYVTTYGDVATAAGTEAREVGAAMARNPIYPIVACHRVVGKGFELVGYAGSRAPAALRSKLDRLAREARGFGDERDLATATGTLHVYPVERVLARARAGESRQRELFE